MNITQHDKDLVKKAIQDLELESSGELVPYIAKNSGDYSYVRWKLALLLGVSSVTLFGGLSYMWLLPNWITPFEITLIAIAFMLLGFFAPTLFPTLKRLLVPTEELYEECLEKASRIFLERELFDTIDRTGILIYISLLEHQVIVLGDKGINAKLQPSDWNEVVALVVKGIQTQQVGQGLAEAISLCKKQLLNNGFIVRKNDINELSDELIIEE